MSVVFMHIRTWKYTDEELAVIARNYDIFSEFRTKESGAYTAASKRGILDKICSHIRDIRDRGQVSVLPSLWLKQSM